MTDMVHSLTVVLDATIREDDAQPIIDAIKQIRGVAAVAGNVADMMTYVAENKARSEIRRKIVELLYPKES